MHFGCIVECKVIKPWVLFTRCTWVWGSRIQFSSSKAPPILLSRVEECVLIKHYVGFRTGCEFSHFSCIRCFQLTERYVNPDVLFSAYSGCMTVQGHNISSHSNISFCSRNCAKILMMALKSPQQETLYLYPYLNNVLLPFTLKTNLNPQTAFQNVRAGDNIVPPILQRTSYLSAISLFPNMSIFL